MVKYKVYKEVYEVRKGSTVKKFGLHFECESLQELNICISTLKHDGYKGEIKVTREIVEELYNGYLEDYMKN